MPTADESNCISWSAESVAVPTPRANDLDGHAETAVDPVGTSDATPEAQLITDGIKAQDCYQSRREELWRRLDREWGDKLSTLEFLKHQLLALEQAILILEDGGVFMRSEDKEGNDSVKGESTKKSAASVSDTSFDRPTPRIAGTFPTCKINPMSWDDYESTRGKANHAQSYAIDLQYEEQLQHSDEKSFSSASGPKVQAIPGSAKIESAAVRRPLPAKIRINSLPAMTAMDLLEDLILTGGYVESAVIPRPYYSLVYLEPKIRQHLCELRRTAVHLEETTGKDDELVLPLDFGSSFRDRVVLSGPDLSLLTLAECKELLNGLQCVVDFIDGYIVPLQKEMADDPRTVRPSELCFLFPSGTFVYVKDKKIPQKVWRVVLAFGAHQIKSASDGQENRDWDGSRFIRVFKRFQFHRFTELLAPQAVSSLPIIPLNYAVRDGLTELESLKKRGGKFIQCTKQCHRYYSGRSLDTTPTGNALWKGDDGASFRVAAERVDSQVMVDFERAFEVLPEWRPMSTSLESLPDMKDESYEESKIREVIQQHSPWISRMQKDFLDNESAKWDRWDRYAETPSEDDLMLLPDRVFAFVFRSRSWCCLQLGTDKAGQERLRPVTRRDDAWSDLQLPDGHKDIVQALVRSHITKEDSEKMDFDLIKDKGEVETKARDVEVKLQYSFQLAQAWDCVLLLDEADIFLAERTEDISRNALVSVFLRVLEYYEGILFLTTNRVGAIDEAFKSRIHMALYYPPLDKLKTKKIWRSQIRRTKEKHSKFKCDEDTLIDYADQLWDQQNSVKGLGPVWNGRQIRNAFKSAVALANYHPEDGEISLQIQHFEKVARVSNEFNNYFWRVHGKKSDSKIAFENRNRDDSYPVNDGSTMYHPQPQYSGQPTNIQNSHAIPRFASAQNGMPSFASQPIQQQQQPLQAGYASGISEFGGPQFSGATSLGYGQIPQGQYVAPQPVQPQQGQVYPQDQQPMMAPPPASNPMQQASQGPQGSQSFQSTPQIPYMGQPAQPPQVRQ
ncbi:hypothetical protein SLS57_011600 [Botryosphaeria dothidea]